MKPALDTRTYTNFVLTAIAVLLAAITLHLYKVGVATDAHAQSSTGFGSSGKSAPIDLSNIPQTQDVAVAAATREIADANRDIASALRELSKSVDGAGRAVSAAAKGGSSAGPARGGAPANPGERPTIEVR
jgi:hypothetical protein